MTRAERGRRLTSVALAFGAVAITVFYLVMISAQGTDISVVPLMFAALFIILGLLPLFAPRTGRPWRTLLPALAASGWLVIAVLTGFSIGIAVLPVALLAIACVAFTLAASHSMADVGGLVGGLLVGLELPFLLVAIAPYLPPGCPQRSGHVSGSATYPSEGVEVTFECQDGHLTSWHVKH